MIDIYRQAGDEKGMEINHFYNRDYLNRDEVIIKQKTVFGKIYTYAEPKTKGIWAFGGDILFTSNGIFPEFTTPIKLHDRDMSKESKS